MSGFGTLGTAGWSWKKLTTTQLTAARGSTNISINQVRVRLWKL